MEADEAISLINELIDDTDKLRQDRNRFDAWRGKCRRVLDRIFGKDSEESAELANVNFRFRGMRSIDDNRPEIEAYDRGVENSKEVLRGFIWEIERFGVPTVQTPDDPQRVFKAVQSLCLRFHAVARQLRARHEGRPTLDVEDEYDVQDLLHALLRLYFDDIRPEEWTPSYAGKSSRMDFLLKKEKVVIEVKKTRNGLDAKRLGEELIIDMAHYRNHSDCHTLICFVYDPENRVANPAGLEADLSRNEPDLTVRVIISPKD
jgi:hypothetical protein